MKKRIITFILAALLLFSCVIPQSYVAAADISEKKITVDADGTVYSLKVYVDASGTLYVPTDTVARLGGMTSSAGSSEYTFYYKSEVSRGTPLAGARRIIIDKSGKSGKVVCYTSGSNYTTIESITFSKAQTINKKLYLPIEEFLPLLDAKVEITSDGIVHIYKNPVPLYRALFSSSNLDLYEFDKDYFVLNDVVTATGLIVDSILGFRFDRLDFVTNSGAIKDYSSLFKKLLTDNETYLSAFDKKETPVDKAIKLISASSSDLDDAIGGTKKVLDMAKYMTTASEHDTYKTFSDEVKLFGSNAAYVEGAIKVIKYANVYYNQVEDHRNMLNAVYGGGSSPAAIAANQTYNLYGKDMAEKVTGAATSALRDYITKELSGAITKGYGLTPYKIAFSAVKLLIPDAVKEFSSAAELYFLDKVVEDAYDASKSRLNNIKYDEESLENLRLSLIMFLVASKRGHESYGITGPDDTVSLIDATLENLYLAADSVECVAKGYYATKKSELSKSKKHINPVDISNNASTKPTESPVEDPSTTPTQCSHTYKNATCTAPKTCSKCGATSGSALGHSYTDATCIAPKTCSKCGATEGGKGSHNYQEGTCSVCGCKQLGYGTWQTFCATGDTRDWMCLFRVRFGDEHTDVVLLDCSAASLYSPEEIADMINFGYRTVDYQGETYFLEAGQSRDCHYEISGDSATIYLDEYLGEEANGLPGKMTLKLSGKDQATVTEITGFDFNGLFGFQGIKKNMIFTYLD